MILVFKYTKLYYDIWESDKKRLNNSIVYNWNTCYKEHNDSYQIKSCNKVTPPVLFYNSFKDPKQFDIAYMEYITNDQDSMDFIAMIAFEINLGFDIVILGDNSNYCESTLYSFLRIITARYGIVSRDINTEEDIPSIPQDSDDISHSGLFYLKEDRPRIRMILMEMTQDPIIKKLIEDRMNDLERVL